MLPPKLVPVLLAVSAVAGAVAVFAPPHTIAGKASLIIMGLLNLFGIASPGWRR